jgi:hypothetical protein
VSAGKTLDYLDSKGALRELSRGGIWCEVMKTSMPCNRNSSARYSRLTGGTVGYAPKFVGMIFASALLTLLMSAVAGASVVTLVKPANNASVSGQVQIQVIDQAPPVSSVEYDIDGQFLASGGPTIEPSLTRCLLDTGDSPKRSARNSDTCADSRAHTSADACPDARAYTGTHTCADSHPHT